MNLEKVKISRLQLYFLVFGFILGSDFLLFVVAPLAKQDIWIATITGLLEAAVFVLIFITLARRFPGKTLIEINDTVYGSIFGKVISFMYIVFFLQLLPLNIRYMSDFFSNTILEKTPSGAIIIVITFLCAYAVKKGLEVIARCSFLLISIFVIEVIFSSLILLGEYNFSNFLPVMEISTTNFLKASNIIATIPFGEIFIFLMIIPFVNKNKKITKAIFYALISAALILFIVIVRNIAVLGKAGYIYSYPSYQAARLINIQDILTRVEVLLGLTQFITIFLKISVIYYALVLAIGQLLNLNRYSFLVLPIGFISVVLSLISFEFYVQQLRFGSDIYPIISLPFEFGLPLLTLIIAKIRKKGET